MAKRSPRTFLIQTGDDLPTFEFGQDYTLAELIHNNGTRFSIPKEVKVNDFIGIGSNSPVYFFEKVKGRPATFRVVEAPNFERVYIVEGKKNLKDLGPDTYDVIPAKEFIDITGYKNFSSESWKFGERLVGIDALRRVFGNVVECDTTLIGRHSEYDYNFLDGWLYPKCRPELIKDIPPPLVQISDDDETSIESTPHIWWIRSGASPPLSIKDGDIIIYSGLKNSFDTYIRVDGVDVKCSSTIVRKI